MAFRAMKIQNFPDIDLPTVTVTASLPGAAPSQLETEVARKIENSIATVQGVKHIYTKVQDGTATITVEFRLEKPTQEAVDDVRDAVSRVRSDLPGDLRDPIITEDGPGGRCRSSPTPSPRARMDDEALSWFVDNDGHQGAARGARRRRGQRASAASTREVRVELDPPRLLALNATAADISRQLRQIQQEASGGRADVGGARAVGAHDRHRAVGRRAGRAWRSRSPTAGASASTRWRRVSDTVAEQRSAALLERQAGGRLRDRRARAAPARSRSADGVRARARRS